MKATRTLLAASIVAALAAVGSANAATIATFNVTVTGVIQSPVTGTVNETGTAVLDSSGVLTIDKSGTTVNSSSGSMTYSSQMIWNGTLSGSIFTITSGTVQNIACLASADINGVNTGTTGCSANLQLGVVQALGPSVLSNPVGTAGQPGGLPVTNLNYVTGLNSNGGAYLIAVTRGLAVTRTSMAFAPTTPAVPVPAAAWLFGSGLLGLAGTARRRRAAATAA